VTVGETRALVRVVAGKQVALLKRYWINTASNLLTNYVMFLVVFLGGTAAAPAQVDNSLGGIIVGFFLWSLSWSAFQGPASGLTDEAQWGTLEQLFASPLGLRRILAVDLVVSLAVSFVTGILLLALMMVTTGTYLVVDVLTVVPLVALSLCSAAGLGFVMGGLALVYKRISQAFLLLQFLFLGALAAPAEPVILQALPLALGNDLLRTAMSEGRHLWELPTGALLALLGKAVAYLGVGAVAFRIAVREARRRGVMGHY
jgi:ABC-2 type transport system permease protein